MWSECPAKASNVRIQTPTHVSSKVMPGSPVVPLDPGLKTSPPKHPTHLPHPPAFPHGFRPALLPLFVSSPAVLWAGVEMTYIKRKDFFFPKKKSFSYILSTVPDTLQPSQGFLIQIQFSSCYHPPVPPSFTSFLHPSFFSFSPPSFFLLSLVSPLAAIFRCVPRSISWWRHERLPVRWSPGEKEGWVN